MTTDRQRVMFATTSGGVEVPVIVDSSGSLEVITSSGIPSSFSKQSNIGQSMIVAKGQLNKLRARPKILNEHVESSRTIQSTITSSNNVGQVFRASQDNINSIFLTLGTASETSFDDFEGYANDGALQTAWVETDPGDLATVETTIVNTGSQSMKIPMDATQGDEWVQTFGSTDYTDYTFGICIYQDRPFSQAGLTFFIGDGSTTKSFPLSVSSENQWVKFNIAETTMTEDGGGVNIAAITKVGIRLHDRRNSSNGYIDDITTAPMAGTVDAKLWEFPSLPVTGVTSLDDATPYTALGDRGIGGTVAAQVSIDLIAGKRNYNLADFVAGVALEIPTNTLLTEGNYYGITLEYVDTEVDVYGPDASFSTNYYNSGYAFTYPNTSTPITAIGTYNDLAFGIYSTQDVYVIRISTNVINDSLAAATPGLLSKTDAHTEDANMAIIDTYAIASPTPSGFSLDLIKPSFVEKGGKIEMYLTDDATDDVFLLAGNAGFLYEPPTVYG